MSIAEVTGRISELQSQYALLTGSRVSGTATAFAASLQSAQATAASSAAATAAVGGATEAAAGSAKGDAVVAEARKYLGVPYVWGGTNPDKGLDCSGLVQLVYKNLGYDLPRVSYQQATAGRAVEGGLKNAQPGDILAFNSPVSHVGIYIGDGKMIEAPRPGLAVRVTDVYDTPVAIRRVVPAESATSVAAVGGNGRLPAGTPYASLFESAGAKYGVSPELLSAVAKAESAYNPRAVSHAGAQGLMQLMPGTAAGLGVTNSFDPAQAVDGAARLLRDLLQEFGRVDLALAGYNAGPGAVKKYDGIPPYSETQNYVRKIMATLEGR